MMQNLLILPINVHFSSRAAVFENNSADFILCIATLEGTVSRLGLIYIISNAFHKVVIIYIENHLQFVFYVD